MNKYQRKHPVGDAILSDLRKMLYNCYPDKKIFESDTWTVDDCKFLTNVINDVTDRIFQISIETQNSDKLHTLVNKWNTAFKSVSETNNVSACEDSIDEYIEAFSLCRTILRDAIEKLSRLRSIAEAIVRYDEYKYSSDDLLEKYHRAIEKIDKMIEEKRTQKIREDKHVSKRPVPYWLKKEGE